MINSWLQFALCAIVIVFAGSKLTKNAAIVADNVGIGTAWVGALMLPLATSLPELVTTLRAVTINVPDLALGNILGSCLFNLSLLTLIDLLSGKGPLTARLSQGHIVTASLSVITVSMATIAILGIVAVPVGWIGMETLLIAVIYIVGGRMLFGFERTSFKQQNDQEIKSTSKQSTLRALGNFALAAALIVAAGILLTDATDRIAVETALGHTFVGTLFLAISTSLPETVTTITAVRLGFTDMAVANVFGANFMNLFIVFIADLFFRQGPLLAAVSIGQATSAVIVIMLSVLIIFGITYRSNKSLFRIGYDTLLVLVGYITAVYLIFKSGSN